MKRCHNCGSIVSLEDHICKSCAELLNTVEIELEENPPYRSRFLLLFYAWLGGILGAHLTYLGYHEEAGRMRARNNPGLLLYILSDPPVGFGVLARMCLIQMTLPFWVMLGGYRTDANGYPVRYFRKKQGS